MLKRIISSILTFILLIILTSLGCLLVARSFLVGSKKDILETKLLQIAYKSNDINSNIFNDTFEKTGIPLEVISYIEESATLNYVDNYLKEYTKYQLGITTYPKLNNKELQEIVNNAVQEYEKDTKKKVNTKVFYDVINALDKERKEKQKDEVEYKEVTQLISVAYDKEAIYLLITLFIICSFLLLLVNKFKDVIKYFSTMFILNGAGLFLLSIVLNAFLSKDSFTMDIGKEICHFFNIFSFVSVDIGLVFFLLLFLARQIKKYKEKNKERLCK